MRGNTGQMGRPLDLHDKAQALVQALGVGVAGGIVMRATSLKEAAHGSADLAQ